MIYTPVHHDNNQIIINNYNKCSNIIIIMYQNMHQKTI